jgi:hypothetical protein
MKKLLSLVILLGMMAWGINAQITLAQVDLNKTYIIKTYDGATFIGKIKSYDKKEVLIETVKLGEVTVPTYQLEKLEEAKASDLTEEGDYAKDNLFATRYFITTNGLPIKKGEAYALINWYGPDIQYGLADNLSVGIMTSWLGTPVIGSVKYSHKINENTSLGLGALVGSMGWASLKTGGALPFAALTVGNRKTNFTVSGGYGALWLDDYDGGFDVSGEALGSFAGMARVSNSLSLVFDSFIIPGFGKDTPFTALLIPGIRFQRKENFALQLGLTGIYSSDMNYDSGGFAPIALPMFQVYWKF